MPSFDCDIAHALTAPESLNHVEVYLTQKHIEVWTSDASDDGVDFPNQHLLWEGDLDLPFARGYVSLALRNHATLKYWLGSAASVRWDNIGFDGPVISGDQDESAPDSLTPYGGLSGCNHRLLPGARWRGRERGFAEPSDRARTERAARRRQPHRAFSRRHMDG